MSIERGIRRVLVVLSVLVTAGWAVFVTERASEMNWSYHAYHTTVEAYCDPARRSVYEVQQRPEEARLVSGIWIPGCNPDEKLPPGVVDDEKPVSGSLSDLGAKSYRPQRRINTRQLAREYLTEDQRIDRYIASQEYTLVERAPTVVIRRAEHRWLREYVVPIAGYTVALSGVSLGLLWATFFSARWIVRGFTEVTR